MKIDYSCALCAEGALHLEESAREIELDGTKVSVPFRIHWCDRCGARQALGEDTRFNARAMRRVSKQHFGLLTGQEVREVRSNLGLSQEQAAKLFGGGPVAFSKYENDEVSQSEAMDRLIWLVGQYPWLVMSLARRVTLELPGEVRALVERRQTTFRDTLISETTRRVIRTQKSFQGFLAIEVASNDGIYHPGVDPQPAERLIA